MLVRDIYTPLCQALQIPSMIMLASWISTVVSQLLLGKKKILQFLGMHPTLLAFDISRIMRY